MPRHRKADPYQTEVDRYNEQYDEHRQSQPGSDKEPLASDGMTAEEMATERRKLRVRQTAQKDDPKKSS